MGPVFNGRTGMWTNDDTMASEVTWEREAQGIRLGWVGGVGLKGDFSEAGDNATSVASRLSKAYHLPFCDTWVLL